MKYEINKGKRKNDPKAKKVKVNHITSNPNTILDYGANLQQFDILTGVEKAEKINPKNVFVDYKDPKKQKSKQGKKNPRRNSQMAKPSQRSAWKKKDKKNPT